MIALRSSQRAPLVARSLVTIRPTTVTIVRAAVRAGEVVAGAPVERRAGVLVGQGTSSPPGSGLPGFSPSGRCQGGLCCVIDGLPARRRAESCAGAGTDRPLRRWRGRGGREWCRRGTLAIPTPPPAPG